MEKKEIKEMVELGQQENNKDLEILNIEVGKRFGEKDKYHIQRKDIPNKFMKFLECFIIGHIYLVEIHIDSGMGYIIINHDLGYTKIAKIPPALSVVKASIIITEYWKFNDTYETHSIKNTDLLNPIIVDFLNNDLKSLKEELRDIEKD